MKYPVGNHFSRKNHHHGLQDVRLFVLEFCQTSPNDDSRGACEAIERKWQFRLHSNFPLGMNRDDALPTGGVQISTTLVEIFDNPQCFGPPYLVRNSCSQPLVQLHFNSTQFRGTDRFILDCLFSNHHDLQL